MRIHVLDVTGSRSEAEPALLPGEVLAGKYRIERVLGRGGMGIVLLAKNMLLGERVAIKLLARGATPSSTPRLLMEARAAARLKSDHVVRVFDVGNTETGEPYLVMEHLEGRSLSELLRQGGAVSAVLAADWVAQACEALAEAHRHGIIHRDVKPANLFLEQRPDGSSRIKVLDFGIAKLPEGENLATTTHPIGSPIYMAPEQLENQKDVDLRVDVWGIGCVLYELLTGTPPFAAASLLALAANVCRGAYPKVTSLRPELPARLSEIVERCLQPDRGARFPDLLALARALAPLAPEAARWVGKDPRARGGSGLSTTLDPAGPAFSRAPSTPGLDDDVVGSKSTPALTSSPRPIAKARRGRLARQAALVAFATLCGVSWVLHERRATPGALPTPGDASVLAQLASGAPAGAEQTHAASGVTEGNDGVFALVQPQGSELVDIVQASTPAALATSGRARPARAARQRERPPTATPVERSMPAADPAAGDPGPTVAGDGEPPHTFRAPGPLPIDRHPPW